MADSSPTLTLPPQALSNPWTWRGRTSKEEGGEIDLPPFILSQVQPLSEGNPSDVVAVVLGDIAPVKEVVESASGIGRGSIEVRGLELEPNKEGELSVDIPTKQPVEQPPVETIEARNTPRSEQVISSTV